MESLLHRCSASAAKLTLAVALAALGPPPAAADLTGQVLEVAPDSQDVVFELLSELLDVEQDEHRIDSVTVVEDSDDALVVEVAYRGLPSGAIRAQLLDPSSRRIVGASASRRLGETAKPVRLEIPPPRGTEDAPAVAGFLRLRATLGAVPGPPIDVRYTLRRAWKGGGAASGAGGANAAEASPPPREIAISARPIGAAQQLGKQQGPPPLPPLRRSSDFDLRATSSGGAAAKKATPLQRIRVAPVAAQAAGEASGTGTEAGQKGVVAKKTVVPIDRFRLGLGAKEKDLGAHGPGSDVIELMDAMRLDVDLVRDDILEVFPLVYRDQNPDAGVYYYLPDTYRLAWGPDEGLAMRFLYTAAADAGSGDVMVALRLDAGVDLGEVALARRLLEAYAKRHGLGAVREFRALPIEAPPEVSLAGDLQHQYDVPAEEVVINGLSDSLGEIEVAFTVDPVTKENVQLALEEEVGISGRVALAPHGGGLSTQEIPLRVRLADAATFGRFDWERGTPWRNETPYPVELRYLHAMMLDGDVPVIYSWALDGERIPPGSSAVIDAATVPGLVDSDAERTWLDYRVATDCDACDRAVIAAISGGVSAVAAQEIAFRTLSPLADTGAVEMVLLVRSRFFHPQKRELVEKPHVVIDQDGATYAVGPIYVAEGEESPADLFEYRLQLVLPDGTVRARDRWIRSRELYQPIGRVQVEESVGSLDGGEGE